MQKFDKQTDMSEKSDAKRVFEKRSVGIPEHLASYTPNFNSNQQNPTELHTLVRDTMTDIKAIPKKSVHQICSGQVVLDLATAVKELVENSLDAGANSIEIKLKEFGTEQIEVCDNGTGVEEKEFAALALKHYTSKLEDFSDLSSVATFGFRGEALSSLCALSHVVISTKHRNASIGSRIEYDHDGRIIKLEPQARQIGTTVTLKSIFCTLPVRKKEFQKNSKKEFTKLVGLLNAYSIISTGVRISCTNQILKGSKTSFMRTLGVPHVLQNITTLFGSKQVEHLKQFQQTEPSQEICNEFNLKPDHGRIESNFTVTGFVSDVTHGKARSSPDRQFYFINQRPVVLARLSKLVNEVFHMFNRNQYPFVSLDIETKRDSLDVNVTPDKRQVFIHDEKLLLATVKSSLMSMYCRNDSHTFSSLLFSTHSNLIPITANRAVDSQSVNATCNTSDSRQDKPDDGKIPSSAASRLSRFRRLEASTITTFASRKRSLQTSTLASKQRKIKGFCETVKICSQSSIACQPFALTRDRDSQPTFVKKFDNLTNRSSSPHHSDVRDNEASDDETQVEISHEKRENDVMSDVTDQTSSYGTIAYDDPTTTNTIVKSLHRIEFCFKDIERRLRKSTASAKNSVTSGSTFQAKILPEQNSAAEKELKLNLDKSSFKQMTPIGQFNLGFIIARCGDDLFIIDQHAADEIYNFETLQMTTNIHTQRLVVPQRLNITAADKMVMVENKKIFQQNGFYFDRAGEDGCQDVIHLTRIPVSKNYQFGVSDVEELIFMLTDAPGVVCQPSRVRQMFASRACRKSVMIGTALELSVMRRLISHMSDIQHPWNCPHGRPTIRHLLNMNRISPTLPT